MMSNRIMYLRDKTGAPVGCLSISVKSLPLRIEYQFSVVNSSKDVFSREVARTLSTDRLRENPITVNLLDAVKMFNISRAVMKNLSRRKDVPSKATKAAKLWLKNNDQSA